MGHMSNYPESDEDWNEDDWHNFIQDLIDRGLFNWEEVGGSVLSRLNTPQVGTSMTNERFQRNHGKGKTWSAVREWAYEQQGVCVDCGTRLELQADHIRPKQDFKEKGEDPWDADHTGNMTLRCRRCNVIRRPSHKKGGLTRQPAAPALMWLLLTKRPSTYQEFDKICREYGLTMANIRFQEAWAVAHWLENVGLYRIDPNSKY
jgi:5-methylcytosine-specific restriction endonuclease McrA